MATTWRELCDHALAAAEWVAALPERPRCAVVVTDNTAECVAVLVGLVAAGVPVACVERDSSYLDDTDCALHRLEASLVVGPPSGRCRPYTELLARPATGFDPSDAAADVPILQLTSGSTGEPRIARLCLSACVRGARLYRDIHRYTEADRVLLPVPMAHSFGLTGGVLASLVTGAELLLLPRFRITALHDALSQGATVLLGTPLLYQVLTQSAAPVGFQPRLRVALSSGGPMAPELAAATERRLETPVYQMYGSTETGLIACQYGRAEPWPEGSVGTEAPGVSWRTGPPLRGGGRHLLVQTSTMFSGYLDAGLDGPVGDPPAADGWYDTGDLVEVDDQGHVFVVGRRQGVINVGGRKVNPVRVERLVRKHPAVRDAHVFGLEQDGGQAVHAAVVLDPGVPVPAIAQFCRDRLAPYEGPHHLHAVDRIPRTGMGKVDLQALYAVLDAGTPAT